ncbi:MAG: hypothetical protein IPM64_10300 [Phycisphaerales bacterium]|nr:hypothetical protein [Phycisphaerales bacterium]
MSTNRNPANDMFTQFTDVCANTMRTCAQFQTESMRFFGDVMTRNTDAFRSTMERFAGDVGPMSRKNVDRMTRVMDETMQRNAETMRSFGEAGRTTNPAEMTERFTTVWCDSMAAMRDTVETFTRANAEMVEQFGETFRGTMTGSNGKTTKTRGK